MAWKFQAARPSHSIQGRPVQGSSDSLSLVRALSILVWTSRMLRYNEIVLSCSGADKIGVQARRRTIGDSARVPTIERLIENRGELKCPLHGGDV